MTHQQYVVGEDCVDLDIKRFMQADCRRGNQQGGGGIDLVEIERDFERVPYHFAGGIVLDDGEGVEGASVGVSAVWRRAQLFPDRCDLRELDPSCLVVGAFEV